MALAKFNDQALLMPLVFGSIPLNAFCTDKRKDRKMSYHYREGGLFCASLLCAIFVFVTPSQADAQMSEEAASRLIRSTTNRSSWAFDQKLIHKVVYESVIKPGPIEVESADISVEDTNDSETIQLRVRLFDKDLQHFSSRILKLNKRDPVAHPERSDNVPELCNRQCIVATLDLVSCPDPRANYNAVFASPHFFDNPSLANSTTAALNAAVSSSAGTLRPAKLYGAVTNQPVTQLATVANYLGWLKCAHVEFFSSLAPIDRDTHQIALLDKNLPADWYLGFKEYADAHPGVANPLTGKVLFFNSANYYSKALWDTLHGLGVQTFIAPKTDFPHSEFDKQFFQCFWQQIMSQSVRHSHGQSWYPPMETAAKRCDGGSTLNVYGFEGYGGPIFPFAEVEMPPGYEDGDLTPSGGTRPRTGSRGTRP